MKFEDRNALQKYVIIQIQNKSYFKSNTNWRPQDFSRYCLIRLRNSI